MFGLGENKNYGKWRENYDFSFFDWSEKGEKWKLVGWSFSIRATIFIPSKLGRKDERKWYWEGNYKLPPLFLLSTFNNNSIIVTIKGAA